ncbi:MAG: hypothetical protein HC773_12330 [Scytonema sp. CRU_2_7]|nr:hypothetical protein [Scytonema sp. CRU_2_7]
MRNGRTMEHELEQEFENEYENEFENEYENEFENEYELEHWHEAEGECEFEHEYESEQFLPLLGGLLARVAPMAIRGIGGLIGNRRQKRRGKRQREFEFEFESEGEYEIDSYIAKLLKRLGRKQRLGESEAEYEYEFESAPMHEYELEMENLAYRAAQSESEAEAEAFLGALLPVSARLFPKSSAKVISAITPSLIEGVATVGRVLHKSPKTRPVLRTVPHIVQGTMVTLARQAQLGKPLSQTTALRVLADHTARVLDNPNRIAGVMKKSHLAQHHYQGMNNGMEFGQNPSVEDKEDKRTWGTQIPPSPYPSCSLILAGARKFLHTPPTNY